MRYTNNSAKRKVFEVSWQNYIAYLTRKGYKIPSRPTPGWLQEVATKHDLCSQITGMINGETIICGAELWNNESPDSWICNDCYNKKVKGKK